LNKDLTSFAKLPRLALFKKFISSYRARLPAGQGASSPSCEQVRVGYENLGCERFEASNDLEPFYYTEEEWREKRLQEIKAAKEEAKADKGQ
jgi:hypothetical protein